MKIQRNSIVVKLGVFMFTILAATAAMLYFKGSISGLIVSVLILVAGFSFSAFVLGGKK